MLKQYGFKQAEAELSLNANKHNQVTTIYYLLHKRYEKLGQLPSHFNIAKRPSNGDSFELQALRAPGIAAEDGSPQGPMTPGLFPGGQNAASMDFGGIKPPESRESGGKGGEANAHKFESTPNKHQRGP